MTDYNEKTASKLFDKLQEEAHEYHLWLPKGVKGTKGKIRSYKERIQNYYHIIKETRAKIKILDKLLRVYGK